MNTAEFRQFFGPPSDKPLIPYDDAGVGFCEWYIPALTSYVDRLRSQSPGGAIPYSDSEEEIRCGLIAWSASALKPAIRPSSQSTVLN